MPEYELINQTHLQHHRRTAILTRESHIVILAQTEMLVREDQLLPLESEIEDNAQMSGVGDHHRQILARDVREESEQESLRIGGSEPNTNVLGNCRSPRAEEVVLDQR